jgi:hypothetical protein
MVDVPLQGDAEDSDHVIVVELGAEGGSITNYGRRENGSWSFWQKRTSLVLDENDEESWQESISDTTNDLLTLLPANWVALYPLRIHPDFANWFRAQYDKGREKLPERLQLRQA